MHAIVGGRGPQTRDGPAAKEASRVGCPLLPDRERAAVLSENRVEGPIRPAYRGDGARGSRDALVLPTPLRWVLPGGRRAFRARLPPGSGCCAVQGSRTNIKNILENGNLPSSKSDPSTTGTTPRTRFAERPLASVPTFDLRPQPEAGTPVAEVEDRSWHVRITAHVQAHRVAVGEPEDPREVMRVNEVFQCYAAGH